MSLIHYITNYVTMNDVANVTIALGDRPIMAEALEELEEIVPQVDGLVVNLGTINNQRIELIKRAVVLAAQKEKPVLLDPVGCGSSTLRLNLAMKLLESGHVNILKVNAKEARALIDQQLIMDKMGVDSAPLSEEDLDILGKELSERYSLDKSIIVVITGPQDSITYGQCQTIISGGSHLQQSITGTGCMLNPLLIHYYLKSLRDSPRQIMALMAKAIGHMNWASTKAAKSLKDLRYFADYKVLLINFLSVFGKRRYLITDEAMDFYNELLPKTGIALRSGVDILQYRVKGKSIEDQLEEAKVLRQLTLEQKVTFIINDNMELAKAVDADGVHLGTSDIEISEARAFLGTDYIIGATAKTVEQGRKAIQAGANYLGVGALYPSPTKHDAKGITIETLKAIYLASSVPVFGIGGLTNDNITEEIRNYTDGVVMISGIYNQIKKVGQNE